jgi:(S)-ureidoglycine aminohydrolase
VSVTTQDRGRRGRAYTLITPGNHYASRLPAFPGATVVKLVTPRLAPSRLAESLVIGPRETQSHGLLGENFEHFLFGLAGDSSVADDAQSFALSAGGFAYLPTAGRFTLRVGAGARLLWLKRRYEPVPDLPAPAPNGGQLDALPAQATAAPGLTRRELIATDDPAHDFNMSLLHFAANAGLPQIEIHDEEHGLWMTAGGGVYHLDGEDHDVAAEDFIYMAPYCPQGFRAGPEGGDYLLYKDVFRDGF